MEYVKLAFFSILCISALFWQVHLACDGDEFQKFQERVQMRTLSGRRMHLAPNAFDHEQIFSVLQCLDICLRTTHCFSVDINLDHPRKICRINTLFETRKHFLVKDENWKHVNISAKHLTKVCPFMFFIQYSARHFVFKKWNFLNSVSKNISTWLQPVKKKSTGIYKPSKQKREMKRLMFHKYCIAYLLCLKAYLRIYYILRKKSGGKRLTRRSFNWL